MTLRRKWRPSAALFFATLSHRGRLIRIAGRRHANALEGLLKWRRRRRPSCQSFVKRPRNRRGNAARLMAHRRSASKPAFASSTHVAFRPGKLLQRPSDSYAAALNRARLACPWQSKLAWRHGHRRRSGETSSISARPEARRHRPRAAASLRRRIRRLLDLDLLSMGCRWATAPAKPARQPRLPRLARASLAGLTLNTRSSIDALACAKQRHWRRNDAGRDRGVAPPCRSTTPSYGVSNSAGNQGRWRRRYRPSHGAIRRQ